MKRVTLDELEALAHEHGGDIEIDNAEGIAVWSRGRQTFYAALPVERAEVGS